ncbi:MAG: FeoC-like transcriptional regulator [Puniceicoccales bacterium]|jgi:hypothetical protein|nr:FeoC-like transcriptional regulator [Puniceicoccales bacterium]
MLEAILKLFNERKITSLEEIAGALHTNPEMVRARLEYLEHHGYLKRAATLQCNRKNCHGCSACGQISPPAVWEMPNAPSFYDSPHPAGKTKKIFGKDATSSDSQSPAMDENSTA